MSKPVAKMFIKSNSAEKHILLENFIAIRCLNTGMRDQAVQHVDFLI